MTQVQRCDKLMGLVAKAPGGADYVKSDITADTLCFMLRKLLYKFCK